MRAERQVHVAVVSVGRRLLVSLLWGLLQAVVLSGMFFAGGVAAGYLSLWASHGGLVSSTNALLGLGTGAAAGLYVNRAARSWVLKARLRRLRARGVSATGTVYRLRRQWISGPKGGGVTKYTAIVQWRDPVTGAHWQGERRYQCYFRRSRRLEAALADGAQVELFYPADRPSRFVINVPFAPTMADVLG